MEIVILGASGSIGTSAINSIKKYKKYKIIGITLGSNHETNLELLRIKSLKMVQVRSSILKYYDYVQAYPNLVFFYNDQGLVELVEQSLAKYILNALPGAIGLLPSIRALELSKTLFLANKESLVMAGMYINSLLKKYKGKIIPIDSEHTSLYYLLKKYPKKLIHSVTLTASGGPFLNYSKKQLRNVLPSDALKHPNYSMGALISINSSTMINKIQEITEAHYLFNIPYENINIIVHKESYVHAFITLKTGEIIAVISPPNMEMIITKALYNDYFNVNKPDFILPNLTFKEVNTEKFPVVELYRKYQKLPNFALLLNAVNQSSVALFLDKKISFSKHIDNLMKFPYTKYGNELKTINDILMLHQKISMIIMEKF